MVQTLIPPATLPREKVAKEDTWAVESLYDSLATFDNELADMMKRADSGWKEVTQWKGKMISIEGILGCLKAEMSLTRRVEKLYTFAHLKHDEDVAEDGNKARHARALNLYSSFSEATSFIDPELVTMDDNLIEHVKKAPECDEFRFHLEKIWAKKPHTLSPEMENIMAMSSKALSAAGKAFRALTDADMVFGTIRGGDGELYDLTHGTYQVHMRSRDRKRREAAFKQYHGHFAAHQNTLAETLNGAVQSTLFKSRARKYSSSVEASLDRNKIPVKVYENLIETVGKGISSHHRYVRLRKRLLHYQNPKLRTFKLRLFDMYVPIIPNVEMAFSYDEAVQLVIESVAPLGKEYQDFVRQGLTEERWCDKFESKNKRSGAYSSGCFDSRPFMLMNYQGSVGDAKTLIHEVGHSLHSLLSNRNQPYHYASYSIFVAEIASTFNEELLNKLLLEHAKSREEKMFLINKQLEDIRGTFFRQTAFAEFELLIHEAASNGVPLTPLYLKSEYRKLVEKYFGPDVIIDEEIDMEWSRIPHFYSPFYVVNYALGISAAIDLSQRVLNGGDKERDNYMKLLKGGCSMYPMELLKIAGVDMTKSEPIQAVLKKFDSLVGELEDLTKDMVPSSEGGS